MLDRLPDARYTVEGRIGGRWWVWQRFATHDEAAAEIERLARAKRFDGARLIETVPSWNGAPPVSRALFVLDPNGPAAVDPATASASEGTAPAETPDALIADPVADAVARALARVAAHAEAVEAAGLAATLAASAAEAPASAETPSPAAAHVAPPEAPPAPAPPVAAEPDAPAPHHSAPIERLPFAWAPPHDPAPAPASPDHLGSAIGAATQGVQSAAFPLLDEAAPLPDAVLAPEEANAFGDADARPAEAASPPAPDPVPAAAEPDSVAPGEPETIPTAATPADPAAGGAADARSEAQRLWEELVAQERLPGVPANDDLMRGDPALPSLAIADDDRVAAIPRFGYWRFKARQIAYTVGAGLASLLLAIASYETTRLLIGLPDLLGEAQQRVAALLAGPERPIAAAARKGDEQEVAQLLRGGFSPNSEDPQGVPALLVAARGGHTGVVRALLDAGADPNRRFGANDTPLLAAARDGLLAAVELMLARGGQVNGRGGVDECDTPLLAAANAGRLDMVNFLLVRGASFDVLPGCRRGPLDAAAAHPRVRDALEAAYQRRLAGVPRAIPTALAADPAAARVAGDGQPVDLRGYATLMYGFSWRDSLDEVKARSKQCRAVGRRYVVCELQVKPLFDDAP